MVTKITKHVDKSIKDWTDVRIESDGKVLSLSVKDGEVLIFSHDSDMPIEITSSEFFYVKITRTDNNGRIKELKFKE